MNSQVINRFYLPQLDGLRFIAFFMVFMSHFPSAANYFNPQSFAHLIFEKLNSFGWMGVDVFLCLSSFLLSSLLIMEHRKTDHISIKHFFIRRALRIWPLYYLVIALSFYVFPAFNLFSPALHTPAYSQLLKEHLFPFSIFMGNFSYAYFVNSLTVSIAPLWTISLEEQFYIFWPVLLYILLPKDRRWFFMALACLVILSMAVRFYILQNAIPYPTIWVFTLARLDPFALGALTSYLYLNENIKQRPFLALCVAVAMFKLAMSQNIGRPDTFLQFFTVDLGACSLIYAALYLRPLKAFFSNVCLAWLGKISFGLYICHDFLIQTTLNMLVPHLSSLKTGQLSTWAIEFVIAFFLVVSCAAASYYCFEKHFLKLKTRFTVIASRPI